MSEHWETIHKEKTAAADLQDFKMHLDNAFRHVASFLGDSSQDQELDFDGLCVSLTIQILFDSMVLNKTHWIFDGY